MFSFIKKRIAAKLVCVVIIVVAVISILASVYISSDNRARLTEYFDVTLANAKQFAELVYIQPLWNYDYDEIARLSRVVLESRFIVAVNVYDSSGFVSGAVKSLKTESSGEGGVVLTDVSEPYRVPEGDGLMRKATGRISNNGDELGTFELFYTEEYIHNALQRFNRKLAVTFLILCICTIVAVSFVLTTLNSPVLELSRIVQRLSSTKDFSLSLEKTGRSDEVGLLYNGFVNLVEQLRLKEDDEERLQRELERRVTRFRELFSSLQHAIDTEEYRERITPSSDQDELAISLNRMLDTLEQADIATKNQNWLKNGQTELNSLIAGEQSLVRFSATAVNFIVPYVDAVIGALFVLDAEMSDFYFVSGYAVREGTSFVRRFKAGEGLHGQTVLKKDILVFTNVPDDYVRVSSSLLDGPPRVLTMIPLLYEEHVYGVLELGSLVPLSGIQKDFLLAAAQTLAVAVNTLQVRGYLYGDAGLRKTAC